MAEHPMVIPDDPIDPLEPTYELLPSSAFGDPEATAAAKLFSEHYGIWGQLAPRVNRTPNARVTMSPSYLRQALVSDPVSNTPDGANYNPFVLYVRATVNGGLIGNVFACSWIVPKYWRTTQTGQDKILWITQLVVSKGWRSEGVAKKMLEKLREYGEHYDYVGILSSHAHAIMATRRVFADSPYISTSTPSCTNLHSIMRSCTISYVQNARFSDVVCDGDEEFPRYSSASTKFYVDHYEPKQALKQVEKRGVEWTLGKLQQGHEFLFCVQRKPKKAEKQEEEDVQDEQGKKGWKKLLCFSKAS